MNEFVETFICGCSGHKISGLFNWKCHVQLPREREILRSLNKIVCANYFCLPPLKEQNFLNSVRSLYVKLLKMDQNYNVTDLAHITFLY